MTVCAGYWATFESEEVKSVLAALIMPLALLPAQQSDFSRHRAWTSPIHARMRAALANLDQGEFTEGHELDRKWRVPKEMVGRRLSQQQKAKRLLAKFER
jgi:hypothetical protein